MSETIDDNLILERVKQEKRKDLARRIWGEAEWKIPD